MEKKTNNQHTKSNNENVENEKDIKNISNNTTVQEKKQVTTLDDINDEVVDKKSDSERIKEILEKNTPTEPCSLDKKLDEKLKNIMTYSTIPFILVSIGFSLFNIGRVRYPLSFLSLSIGIMIISVFYFIRRKNMLKCNCPLCKTQAKVTLQFGILFGVIALGLLGAFIYFMIVPQKA